MNASTDLPPGTPDYDQLRKMVREHVHDARNIINCLSLETALHLDTLTDPEAVESATRISTQLDELEVLVGKFSKKFAQVGLPPDPEES